MSITRIEIQHPAATQWPLNSVPCNQSGSHAEESARRWRTDCSGFVSMCLNLTEGQVGGRTTAGLVTTDSSTESRRAACGRATWSATWEGVRTSTMGKSSCSTIGCGRTARRLGGPLHRRVHHEPVRPREP